MENIGVIGAGVMGRGVAHALSSSGFQIILVDINKDTLDTAMEEIEKNLRMQVLFNKAAVQPDEVLPRIQCTTDLTLLKGAGFIVENITENPGEKKKLYREIDRICKDDCIFLANTSCISITKLASFTGRPDRVIGAHFMNPVHLIEGIEIIKGYHTSPDTIEKVKTLMNTINKECIIVDDLPGFVSNRISHLLMNEAVCIVQDNVATPEQIDTIFKKCYGHKMGPLETADLIGLDTVMHSLDVLYESYLDQKYRCSPLLRKMVDAGLLGRKSGEGFYKYTL